MLEWGHIFHVFLAWCIFCTFPKYTRESSGPGHTVQCVKAVFRTVPKLPSFACAKCWHVSVITSPCARRELGGGVVPFPRGVGTLWSAATSSPPPSRAAPRQHEGDEASEAAQRHAHKSQTHVIRVGLFHPYNTRLTHWAAQMVPFFPTVGSTTHPLIFHGLSVSRPPFTKGARANPRVIHSRFQCSAN